MKRAVSAIFNRTQTFAIIIGFTDGILNALTLASGHLIAGTKPTIGLSLRIAFGSAICGIFVFFTAEYARLRGELIHAESQLNLASHGRFATSQLGKQIRNDAFISALISSFANFLGSLFPLLLGYFMPNPPILAIVPAILALGLLGIALAHIVRGRSLTWLVGLVTAGIALSAIGVWLHIA